MAVFVSSFDLLLPEILLHKTFNSYPDTLKYLNCTKRALFNYVDKTSYKKKNDGFYQQRYIRLKDSFESKK